MSVDEGRILDHLESLVGVAHVKGLHERFPRRFNSGDDNNVAQAVEYHCAQLDALGVSFLVQNKALMLINDVDSQETWEVLYKASFRQIAKRFLGEDTRNA